MSRKMVLFGILGIGIAITLLASLLTLLRDQPENKQLVIEDGPFSLSLSGYQPKMQLGESLNLVGKLENRSDKTLSILKGPSIVFVTVEKVGSSDIRTVDSVGRPDTLFAKKAITSGTVFSPTEKGRYRLSTYASFIFLEDYPTVTDDMRFYSEASRSVFLKLEDQYVEVV